MTIGIKINSTLGFNILINIASRAWPSLLGILFIPVYIRYLGVESYGLVGFYAVLQSAFGLLDIGIGSTLTRELARLSVITNSVNKQRDLVRTLETIYFFIAVISGAVIYLFAPLIGRYWLQTNSIDPNELTHVIRVMGLAISLQFPFGLYQGGLMGLQKQMQVNLILVLTGTLRGGGAVLVLWLLDNSVLMYMYWQVICSFIGATIFILLLRKYLHNSNHKPKFSFLILADIKHYAFAIGVTGIVGACLTLSDKLILSHLLPMEEFAYYSIASTLAAVIWIIITPLNNAVFPQLVELFQKNSTVELKDIFHLASNYLTLLILPIAVVISIFSRDILIYWTGNLILADSAKSIVSLLVIGSTINGMCSIPAYAASAFGWPKLQMKTNLIQLILIVPLLILATNLYGAEGAAMVWVLINAILMVGMTPIFFIRYLNSERREWYLRGVVIPIILSFSIGLFSKEVIKILDQNVTIYYLFFIWLIISISNLILLKRIRVNLFNFFSRDYK